MAATGTRTFAAASPYGSGGNNLETGISQRVTQIAAKFAAALFFRRRCDNTGAKSHFYRFHTPSAAISTCLVAHKVKTYPPKQQWQTL